MHLFINGIRIHIGTYIIIDKKINLLLKAFLLSRGKLVRYVQIIYK